jgi:hypothetical protein
MRRFTPYNYGDDNSIRNIDPDGMAAQPGCDPCDVPSEGDITGNGRPITENVYQKTVDGVTAGFFTLGSAFVALQTGGSMQEASFDYSGGERKMTWSKPLTSGGDKAIATGNALLGMASGIPADGPIVGLLSKTPGAANSFAAVAKDLSTAEKEIKITDVKSALTQVHKELGLEKPLPKGAPGKFGSPTAGTKQKGYRLDPAHPGNPNPNETVPHINFWDWTNGKKGTGGKYGAIPIIKPI